MAEDDTLQPLPGDNPIRNAEDDKLDRAGVAEHFGRAVLALDRSEGAVVGVFGPWGSGKTSFVNLARPTLEAGGATVIEFNPWMFSGAEQLVERFLGELSAELKIGKLRAVGKALEDYGDALSGTARSIAKVGETAIRRHEGGIAGRRKKVEEALRKRGDEPIVVVLDDVDRLSSTEIRDIFKLVRLTASFPNLIYIVVCDRERVEQALGESGLSGRDYLEKIVQLPFDLPEIQPNTLRDQFRSAIRLEHWWKVGDFDRDRFNQIEYIIVSSLIRNMRDVRRYAAALHGTIIRLQGRVAIPDVIALESLRIFEPDVFKRLYSAIHELTTDYQRAVVDEIIDKVAQINPASSSQRDRCDYKIWSIVKETLNEKYKRTLHEEEFQQIFSQGHIPHDILSFLFLSEGTNKRLSIRYKHVFEFYFEYI